MFPEIGDEKMTGRAKSSLASHRARMERKGFVRVEVNVRKEDAGLVRRVAAALADPARQAGARLLLRQRFAEPSHVSLKALLASAPLDGIDLDRGHDLGREVDL
jgi:alpha-glucuronidase